ncbi:hypothetical protein K4A83_21350 [Spirulina subsalsa FACHB-351]|uniref:Uncharacterized protein n=1 Tax=Spirulina subsalsa FACHB-351 TaxID=234711 RepID=A0ABT3LBB0_9CYAN|nr:hypothetical protein [Spirulina subsalsa]MCW6038795.1 hypothetical protein [Spirulina subsalsa FACHB-351]
MELDNMESIKIKAHVGQDGVLSLQLPVKNQDIEAMVIYQAIQKRSHQDSKRRFEAMLRQHQGQNSDIDCVVWLGAMGDRIF